MDGGVIVEIVCSKHDYLVNVCHPYIKYLPHVTYPTIVGSVEGNEYNDHFVGLVHLVSVSEKYRPNRRGISS